jgi:toxin ParE1/3/4
VHYNIFLAIDAEKDILSIFEYVFYNDSPERADYVYTGIKESINNLKSNPERGHVPKEFEKIGIKEYLEIHFKPFRIIYQINKMNIIVHCVLDGRRDLEDLLHRRLIR